MSATGAPAIPHRFKGRLALLRDRGFVEPFNRRQGLSEDGFEPFGAYELNRSGAILADPLLEGRSSARQFARFANIRLSDFRSRPTPGVRLPQARRG